MKILLDTNVIIDNLASREPFNQNAKAIFNLIAKKQVVGYVNTSSVTDIYYILRKTLSDTDSRVKIRMLLNLLQAIEVTKNDCFTALDSTMTDFEDALIFTCAERENLDFVITRDLELLKTPKAIAPDEFLEKSNL